MSKVCLYYGIFGISHECDEHSWRRSFGIIVTRFEWVVHRLVASNKSTMKASDASCKAKRAADWNRRSFHIFWAISRAKRWNGNFFINNSVEFWKRQISFKTPVPGWILGNFIDPVKKTMIKFFLVMFILLTNFRNSTRSSCSLNKLLFCCILGARFTIGLFCSSHFTSICFN